MPSRHRRRNAGETVRFSSTETDDSEQWAPVADLMAALMLIFMFIAIVFIRTVVAAEDAHREECSKIYHILKTEFGGDFAKWDVELLEDLTIRFRNPEVLFEKGQSEVRPNFQKILKNFFPRYMDAVRDENLADDIREIRIEGHTSSEYGGLPDAYFLNMGLSQRRTRAILRFVLELPQAQEYAEWAISHITANGLSSSRLILDSEGKEDKIRSRRVEFRLLTASCQKAGVYENQRGRHDENPQ